MKNYDGLLNQISGFFDIVRNEGYSAGKEEAKKMYGQSKGIAHCKKATQEECDRHGIELWGWCDCGKPIEGRWVGLANFCPWCGKIIEWKKEDSE